MEEYKFKALDEWRFSVEASTLTSPCVWMHISFGPGGTGAHITVEQARAIGDLFINAADQAEAAMNRVEEE